MIGIDVGGANLKVVDNAGVHIHYCPLWEQSPITELLRQHVKSASDPAAVVMSGEYHLLSMRSGRHFTAPGFTVRMPGSMIMRYPSLRQLTG
jgi:hypothetical protein